MHRGKEILCQCKGLRVAFKLGTTSQGTALYSFTGGTDGKIPWQVGSSAAAYGDGVRTHTLS